MTSLAPCSNSNRRNVCLCTGPQQEQACGRPEVGWHRGPVSWSRESVPTSCPRADREQEPPCRVYLSAVCRAHDRVPFRCGPGSLHHPASSPCRWRCVGRVGTLVLGLTRGWYTECARTGGTFVVDVVDRSVSVRTRYCPVRGVTIRLRYYNFVMQYLNPYFGSEPDRMGDFC
jgi:hypothetical protein